MKFNTWKIAKIYLENFAKQEGFYFRKRRCVCDPVNNSIIHHHTFECSHIQKHEAKKAKLIEEYLACEQYLMHTLYKSEVSNKIIKDKLNQNSQLIDIIKEIQSTFDKQSEKSIISECKNEILTRGLPNIIEEYFSKLNKLLREYLTPQIFQKQ
ncbi:11530_t:CDS:2, partial [Funneliformis geosporum]